MSEATPAPGLRIVVSLRASFLDDIQTSYPRQTLYFELNRDLAGAPIPNTCHRVGTLSAVVHILRTKEPTIELPEPLFMRFLPRWLILAIACKLRSLRRTAPIVVGVYAIENNDFRTLVSPNHIVPSLGVRPLFTVLRWIVLSCTDRWWFGTGSAFRQYSSWLSPLERLDTVVSDDLGHPEIARSNSKQPLTAVFVGELETRKGIHLLLDAWEEVEGELPGARLTIIGAGALEARVASWAALRPHSRTFTGRLSRANALRLRRDMSVQVAPSIPHGRWREQIGQPITEALSLGMTIVTSSETGIADFLVAHGHQVVETSKLASELSAAIVEALRYPLAVESVIASLPTISGRVAADQWLHA